MRTVLDTMLRTAAIASMLFLCLVLFDAHCLFRTATFALLDAQDTLSDASQTLSASKKTIARLDATVGDTQAFLKAAQPLFRAETKQIQASTKELQKTEADARLLIVRTNESLNGKPGLQGLIPQATRALVDVDQAVGQSTNILRTVDRTVADPDITQSIHNIEVATDNLQDSTKEATSTLQETHKTMVDVRKAADYELDELMKPISKLKAAGLFVLRGLGAFYGY